MPDQHLSKNLGYVDVPRVQEDPWLDPYHAVDEFLYGIDPDYAVDEYFYDPLAAPAQVHSAQEGGKVIDVAPAAAGQGGGATVEPLPVEVLEDEDLPDVGPGDRYAPSTAPPPEWFGPPSQPGQARIFDVSGREWDPHVVPPTWQDTGEPPPPPPPSPWEGVPVTWRFSVTNDCDCAAPDAGCGCHG